MLGRYCWLFVLMVLATLTQVNAQVAFQPVSIGELRSAWPVPSSASILRPPSDMIATLQKSSEVAFSIPTSKGTIAISARRFELFTPEATVVMRNSDGEQIVEAPLHFLYRGSVDGRQGSSVFLAVFETHVVGIIEFAEPEGMRRYLLSPDTVIAGRVATHVFYEVGPRSGTPRECLAETLPDYQRRSDSVFATLSNESVNGKTHIDLTQVREKPVLQLALDCTFSLYKNLGSSLSTVATSAIAIVGACAVVFDRDAAVLVRVPYLRIWTEADPYPGEIGAKLGALRVHWEDNMKHVPRAAACLLSGEGGGGLAWVGVLCGGYGYNVSGVDGAVNFPNPNYVWDVDVTSHELGHNIGSPHTHNCGWNPPIDSCWNAEGGCYQNTRPRRGTIMSYCHLQWKGTELALHPRVASLFHRTMKQAGCISAEPPRHDTDVAVIGFITPGSGYTIPRGRVLRPEIRIRNTGTVTRTGVRVTLDVTTLANVVEASVSAVVETIAPGQSLVVTLPNITFTNEGDKLCVASVVSASDQHPTNDKITRPIRVGPSVGGAITVVWPNGGERLLAGSTVEVLFTSSGVPVANVQYSIDGGMTWSTLRHSIPEATKKAEWVVPYTPSLRCLVRARSLGAAEVFDISDAAFTIEVPVDVEAYNIEEPAMNGTVQTPIVPRAVVMNHGKDVANDVAVNLQMRWVRSAGPSYDTTIIVPSIIGGGTATVVFPATDRLANGVHVATLRVTATADSNLRNNELGREFTSIGISPPYAVRYEEGPGRVLLQWTLQATTDNMRVEIWRGSSLATMQRIRTLRTSVNTFVDDRLENDSLYVYALRCIDGNAQSVFTQQILARPTVFPAGSKMAKAVVVSPTDGSTNVSVPVTIVISPVKGADQYEVQVASDVAFSDLLRVDVVRDASPFLAPMEFNAIARCRVRALNQSHTGEWSQAIAFTTTKNCAGNAMLFNGSSDKLVDKSFEWEGGPVTVEYWTLVRREDRKSTTGFCVGVSDDVRNRFQAHTPWEDSRFYWDYGNIEDKGRISTGFNEYYDKWVHVALVSDGTSFKAIYFNGELKGVSTEAGAPTGLKELTIGAMRNGLWFKGHIDEFRIWKVARSADEITSTMFRRLPPTSENSKLVAAWRFDEGSGTTTRDAVRGRVLEGVTPTMWKPSSAFIACDDLAQMPAPEFTSGIGAPPQQRSGIKTVTWKPLTATRGATWYQALVIDPDTKRVIADLTPVLYQGSGDVRCDIYGLPADSTMTIRVRALSTFGEGLWSEGTISTLSPCESHAIRFSGRGERLTAAEMLFSGRACTIEYWSNVATTELKPSVAFMIGERDDETKRLQAHGPWEDKRFYWDYGNWRETGRVSASYERRVGVWTHVALVSNGYDSMAMYFDGQLEARSSFADSPLLLKSLTIGGNPYTRTFHAGAMRDFRVWNVMRSQKQIITSMYERIAEPRSGLLSSWLLDEGEGLRANDATERTPQATSGTELGWFEVPEQNMMHAGARLQGRRDVQIGDTARYTLPPGARYASSWHVNGGRLNDGNTTNESLVVRWLGPDTVGTVNLIRMWPGGCYDVTVTTVRLHVTLSQDDEELNSNTTGFRVFPNPMSDECTVVCNGTDRPLYVDVLDLQGRAVLWLQPHTETVRLNTHNLPAGTYVVRVRTESGVFARTVSIIR